MWKKCSVLALEAWYDDAVLMSNVRSCTRNNHDTVVDKMNFMKLQVVLLPSDVYLLSPRSDFMTNLKPEPSLQDYDLTLSATSLPAPHHKRADKVKQLVIRGDGGKTGMVSKTGTGSVLQPNNGTKAEFPISCVMGAVLPVKNADFVLLFKISKKQCLVHSLIVKSSHIVHSLIVNSFACCALSVSGSVFKA